MLKVASYKLQYLAIDTKKYKKYKCVRLLEHSTLAQLSLIELLLL